VFSMYAILAAFGTYFCMYAFRKPFTVATFEEYQFWGFHNFKIVLVLSQALGYTLSKFIGIGLISSLSPGKRIWYLLAFIGMAQLALLGFALVPPPFNTFMLFINGLPLGMIWGIVFSYLEGRKTSEVLGAGLSVSFIVSSGAVKSIGKYVMDAWGFNEQWMPFITGSIFILPLLFFAFLLDQIPAPSQEDQKARTQRPPMSRSEKVAFFRRFSAGIISLVIFYMLLTAFRDFRDNFMAELWIALGYGESDEIFTQSELIVSLFVLLILGSMMLIRNNKKAFFIYHLIILFSVLLVALSTFLFEQKLMSPFIWMVMVGLGLYLAYVPFGCLLFDRMIAAFRSPANAAFLIYIADAFGYLGSIGILIYKDFGQPDLSWLAFFINTAYILSLVGLICLIFSFIYFYLKIQKIPDKTASF
ncbi:MAG: DUF5690 family protein, partial [Bacteroidota bacterium]